MKQTNSMMRIRTTTKERLRAIADRKRWPLVEAVEAAVEQLEASEAKAARSPRTRNRRSA